MNGEATNVEVQFASDEPGLPEAAEIREWIIAALELAGNQDAAATEVVVRIVDSEEMRALNRDYRDKDKATNVLSFPAEMPAGLPGDQACPLGDIVLCAPIVKDEASRQGKALADHWGHLLVHGTLHLLGFDHIKKKDAKKMESMEIRILAGRKVADPYRVP